MNNKRNGDTSNAYLCELHDYFKGGIYTEKIIQQTCF